VCSALSGLTFVWKSQSRVLLLGSSGLSSVHGGTLLLPVSNWCDTDHDYYISRYGSVSATCFLRNMNYVFRLQDRSALHKIIHSRQDPLSTDQTHFSATSTGVKL